MAIDGTYKIEIESPIGIMGVTLTLQTRGEVLNGASESSFGKTTFSGKVNGDAVSWDSRLNGPIGEMQLSFKGKIEGNDFTGEVSIGMFGSFPFKGKRV
jgi:hypothetical protein